MTSRIRARLLVFLLCMVPLMNSGAADRPFYAFQNGVHRSTDDDRAALLEELGYDGIGSANLPADGDPAALFARYEKRGLKVYSFYVGATVTEDGATVPPLLRETIPKLADSGVVLEFFVRGNKSLPRSHVVGIVREVADLAQKSGVDLVLYPHTGFYVETFSEAVALAKEVDRENVGVMFNLCHFLKVEPEADLQETLVAAGPLLWQVSISGADRGGKDWSALIQPLGEGSYDVSTVLKTLDEIGFNGPVGLQCYAIKGKSEDFLKKSMTAWQGMR